MTQKRKIKEKNILAVYLLAIFTLGVYAVVWSVKSKRDINSLGGDIPNSFLMFVPVVNIYWIYKYSEGFACHVKKDDNTILYFLVSFFVGFVTPFIVQSELNKHALRKSATKAPVQPAAA